VSAIGRIYVINNIINEKQYVGQTIQPLNRRWAHHIWASNNQPNKSWKLYNAIRKYGADNFSIMLLEECANSELNEREQYWIKELDTYNLGYNLTLGGEGNYKINHNEVINLYLQLKNQAQVAERLDISLGSVATILKSYNIETKSSYDISIKQVFQYDISGTFIANFDSITDAAKWILEHNKSNGTIASVISDISKAVRKENNGAYGFLWTDIYSITIPSKIDLRTCKKQKNYPVLAQDKNNQIIEFNSVAEASRFIVNQGLSTAQPNSIATKIRRYIKTQNELYDFYWSYKE